MKKIGIMMLFCVLAIGVQAQEERCPRNRNSPRETYFSFPKTVIL